MQKETFDKIINTLETRLDMCEQYLKGLDTTDDLRLLTIGQAQAIQRFCREEEALMSKMVQTDLYHIIGMGNLSPNQMMKFTYLIKDYLQYRSTIKTIAFNFDRISALPGLPVSAIYKTHSFENLTLLSGVGFDMPVPDGMPYVVSGQMIKVLKDQAAAFVTLWSSLNKVNFSLNNLQQKAKANTEYGGLLWHIDADENYIGTLKAGAIASFTVLENYYKSRA